MASRQKSVSLVVACTLNSAARTHPSSCCSHPACVHPPVHTVGKPTQAFFEIALRSLEKDGITSTNWTSVGMVRPLQTSPPLPILPSSLTSPQIGDDWRQDTGLVAHQLGLRRYLVQTGKFRPGDETRLQEQGAPEPEWTGGCFAEAVEEILKSAE